ncbi:ogr/Delta-like zinc finger family protein [Chitinimonas sp. JJ19]|uniref:ogr/Delta-like zinc finger family protein n=1 Tax=Chitinimonas sp. JJ19 TaxID=3109352 RepID=UPI0030028ABA
MSIRCPHCGKTAHTRTSKQVSRLSREVYFQCSNLECGHTFVGVMEIVRTLSPSAMPNPEVRLAQTQRQAQAY